MCYTAPTSENVDFKNPVINVWFMTIGTITI